MNGAKRPQMMKKADKVKRSQSGSRKEEREARLRSPRPLGGNGAEIHTAAMMSNTPNRRAVHRTALGKPTFAINSVTRIGNTTPPTELPLATIPVARPRRVENHRPTATIPGRKSPAAPTPYTIPWERRIW